MNHEVCPDQPCTQCIQAQCNADNRHEIQTLNTIEQVCYPYK